jgi:predicted metal-dependent HD superfamily phosphohydrolase
MLSIIADLKSRWNAIFGASTATICDEILRHYEEDVRHYHGLTHLEFLFRKLDTHFPEYRDNRSINLAIWFHDVVMSPYRRDNETRSAKFLLDRAANLGVSAQVLEESTQLILATKLHEPQLNTQLEAAFLDLDLLILAANAEDYARYRFGVHHEVRLLPYFLYRYLRKKVLLSFLQREKIFISAKMAEFEDLARENINHEFKILNENNSPINVDYEVNDTGTKAIFSDGRIDQVTWSEVNYAEILTTDEGPFVEDVFLLLHGPSGRGCVIPQMDPAFKRALDKVGAWPGFDSQAVIRAMGSTQNAHFPIWKKPTSNS